MHPSATRSPEQRRISNEMQIQILNPEPYAQAPAVMKDGLTQTVGSTKKHGAASCAAEDVLAEILENTGCAYGEYWVRAELESDLLHPLGRKVSTRSGGGRPGGAFRFSMENVFGQLSPMMSLAKVSRTGSDSERGSAPSRGGASPMPTPKSRTSISEKSPFASLFPGFRSSPSPIAK